MFLSVACLPLPFPRTLNLLKAFCCFAKHFFFFKRSCRGRGKDEWMDHARKKVKLVVNCSRNFFFFLYFFFLEACPCSQLCITSRKHNFTRGGMVFRLCFLCNPYYFLPDLKKKKWSELFGKSSWGKISETLKPFVFCILFFFFFFHNVCDISYCMWPVCCCLQQAEPKGHCEVCAYRD